MQKEMFQNARIVIVDDQDANVLVLKKLLRELGYTNIVSTTDPRQAAALCQQSRSDLVILDLLMPHLDGFGVLEQLKALRADTYLPVLVLTADITTKNKRRALLSGATDLLTKPFDAIEVQLRIENLLHMRFLYVQLARQKEILEGNAERQLAS